MVSAQYPTLLDVIQAVSEVAASDLETLASEPLQRGRVEDTIHGLCDSDEGIRTMRREQVEMTWSEVVTAFAVIGIITFLLLL